MYRILDFNQASGYEATYTNINDALYECKQRESAIQIILEFQLNDKSEPKPILMKFADKWYMVEYDKWIE